jgi:DNA-binding Lrp family transcriptional regulator
MESDKDSKKQDKLDKKNKRLLYELTFDARESLTKIADRVGVSKQSLNYRILSLVKRSIIKGYNPIIRFDQLGLNVYRCLFWIKRANNGKKNEILDYLIKNKNIFSISRVGWRWDIVADFLAPNISGFSEMLNDIMGRYENHLSNYRLLTVGSCTHYKRKYLSDNFDVARKTCFFGGKPNKNLLDKKESVVLNSLLEDGGRSNFTISKKIGISPGTVKDRIISMQRKGIIQGFNAAIDISKMGWTGKRILIKVPEDSSMNEKMDEFASNDPNVTSLDRLYGKWSYELGVECFNEKKFSECMRRLRDNFGDMLDATEVLDVRSTRANYENLKALISS